MRVVESLEELDAVLDRAAAARAESDDAFRASLANVLLQPKTMLGKLPRDPSSAEYRAAQLRFYEQLTRRAYDVAHEETEFDRAHLLRWPFPYVTRSAATVGGYLMMYGQIVKEMNLPPNARILEMGSGYGPLTYHLASMGHRVTCIDISENLLEYIRTRCEGLPGAVDTICADMNTAPISGIFDAVIFFESFHHVLDHADLLRRLGDCLDDDGILVLAGEPVVATDSPIVPYPWGLRMDGLSLWAIRRQGWLELGFRTDYFSNLLQRAGWSCKRIAGLAMPGSDIWICRRGEGRAAFRSGASGEPIMAWSGADEAIFSQCGRRDADANALKSDGTPGYLAYGPYVALDAGSYEVVWKGACTANRSNAIAEVAGHGGADVLREVPIAESGGELARARFHLPHAVDDIEFRVRIGADDVVTLTAIELRPLKPATRTEADA